MFFFSAGLRLFTRKAVDPASTAVMLQKLKDLGYDTSMLLPVQHTGCNYSTTGTGGVGGEATRCGWRALIRDGCAGI
jgi:hypothetical protein